MSSDTPKHPPSLVDPGGAKPATPPAKPRPETEDPGGMSSEGGETRGDASSDAKRKGGMIGEG